MLQREIVGSMLQMKRSINCFNNKMNIGRIFTLFITTLLIISLIYKFKVHQMNATKTFWNGDLDQGMYMKQPDMAFQCFVFELKVDFTKQLIFFLVLCELQSNGIRDLIMHFHLMVSNIMLLINEFISSSIINMVKQLMCQAKKWRN